MFCVKCGNKIDDNVKFCNKCGAPVNKNIQVNIGGTASERKHVPEAVKQEAKPMQEPAPAKVKKPVNKKLILALSLVFVFIIAGLAVSFLAVKVKTDEFKNYIEETEKKAKEYSSLGEYSGEYSSLIDEAGEAADSYNIFKFESEKEKIDTLFKNIDELKSRVDECVKNYEDIVNEIEVKNRLVFGDYADKYEEAKKKVTKAIENLDEKKSKEGVSELAGMLSDIKAYNEKKAKEYQETVKKMSSSGNYFDAEKGFITEAKKNLEEALKTSDYIKAEEVFNEFNEQKKRYDDVAKSDLFDNFIQMDVSEDKTVKLYYNSNGNPWKQEKFTLLEKAKGGKTWSKAEIISMNQVQGKLGIDLVADVSGSMEDMFYDMKESVKNFANSTDSGTKIGLSIISNVYRRESEFTEDKSKITDLVDELTCDGLTSLYQSLYSSVMYCASQPGAKCVVAFTDGINEPYGTGYDFDENDVINVAKRYKVPVYIISLGDYVESSVLSNIAYSTGGRYYEDRSAYDLYEIYEEIYNSQKEIYELAYKSDLENSKEREVYINYYDEESGKGARSEFSINPDVILSGYSASGIVENGNLVTYYTKKKYLSVEEVAGLKSIGELQTIINIYCAKAGYKFKPGGEVLKQMKDLGVIKKNGKKSMARVTAALKKNPVLWANYSTLFNYRYEWIYGIVSRLYHDGYTDLDELNEMVHDELGEEKGRFILDVKKAYKAVSRDY